MLDFVVWSLAAGLGHFSQEVLSFQQIATWWWVGPTGRGGSWTADYERGACDTNGLRNPEKFVTELYSLECVSVLCLPTLSPSWEIHTRCVSLYWLLGGWRHYICLVVGWVAEGSCPSWVRHHCVLLLQGWIKLQQFTLPISWKFPMSSKRRRCVADMSLLVISLPPAGFTCSSLPPLPRCHCAQHCYSLVFFSFILQQFWQSGGLAKNCCPLATHSALSLQLLQLYV